MKKKKLFSIASYTLLSALFVFGVIKMSDAVYASNASSVVPVQPSAKVLGANSTVKKTASAAKSTTTKATAKKTTAKKPVKKTTKKKAAVVKKKSVDLAPPLITVATAPHSPKP